MRRKRFRNPRRDWVPVVAIAFGAGLLLALFGSLKLALICAAIALIYLGISLYSC